MSRPSLFTGFLRRMAALLMLVAAAALAPAAIAGSFELGTDAAKLAASSFSIDADGCVTDPSLTSTDQQPTDAEHCPACCLHHHGPNGLMTDVPMVAPFAPSRAAWTGWEPSGLVEAPEPVLIQPPRA
ncbi:hypothetical protein [Sandaracinobacteroides hominis]|uniref:hypothetical protein n=1 Tax=Sandaracinobacteroides hominis TaxID=2780086 RepID=UPI0018F3A445|nr:hypothetical protein [Sandaracinobacteroides hominis]